MFQSFKSQVIETYTPLISFSPHKVRKLRTIWLIKTYLLWHGRKNNCWWKLLVPPAPVSRLATSESCWAAGLSAAEVSVVRSQLWTGVTPDVTRYWHSCDHTTLQESEVSYITSRAQWDITSLLEREHCILLLWAQEWEWSEECWAQQPGPVCRSSARKHWFCKFWAWAADLTLTQENTTSANILQGWDKSNKVWLSLVIYAVILDFWKIVNKETSRGQKSCWCSCLEVIVTVSEGKKLSCYFSIISMQRGWWWSYWWWQEPGGEQISEMGLGWLKITRNVRSCLWCLETLMSD